MISRFSWRRIAGLLTLPDQLEPDEPHEGLPSISRGLELGQALLDCAQAPFNPHFYAVLDYAAARSTSWPAGCGDPTKGVRQ